MKTAKRIFLAYTPFWLFLAFFKYGGALHYTLLAPYGEKLMPIWVAGLIIGGESLVQMSLDVPAGYLLDRFGYRRLLCVTAFAFIIAAACFAFGLTLASYLITIAISVPGWLFYSPGVNAYILSEATEEESGRFFSLRDVSSSTGVVAASVSLPFVLIFSPQWAGAFLMLLFALALISIFLSRTESRRLPEASKRTPHEKRHSIRRSVAMLWRGIARLNPASGMLVLLTFVGSFFYGVIWFVVPLVVASQVSGAGFMGLGLAVFDFSVVVLGYVIGLWADRAEKRAVIFFGLLLFALCGMAVGANFGLLFIFFGFLSTAGEEMAGISLWSWMHHLDHAHDSDGTISGIITLFDDFGYALGPVAAGILYTVVGPGLAITLGALPIFIVWIVYLFFVERHIPFEALYKLAPHRPRRMRHKS